MKESLHFAGLPRRIPAQCNSAADAGAAPVGDAVEVSGLLAASREPLHRRVVGLPPSGVHCC
jgi:hypothetical protein